MKENKTNSLLAYRRGRRMDDRLLLDEGFEVVEMDGKKYVKVQVYFADRPDNTSADLIFCLEAENATLLSELEGYKRSIPRMFNDMRRMMREKELCYNNLERQRIFHNEKEKDKLKHEIEARGKVIAGLQQALHKGFLTVEEQKELIESMKNEKNSLTGRISRLEKKNEGYAQMLGEIDPMSIPVEFVKRYDAMRTKVKQMSKEIDALQTEIALMKLRKNGISGKAVPNNADSPDSA